MLHTALGSVLRDRPLVGRDYEKRDYFWILCGFAMGRKPRRDRQHSGVDPPPRAFASCPIVADSFIDLITCGADLLFVAGFIIGR